MRPDCGPVLESSQMQDLQVFKKGLWEKLGRERLYWNRGRYEMTEEAKLGRAIILIFVVISIGLSLFSIYGTTINETFTR